MMIFACVEKGERLRRVFFQNSKIPNLSLISAFRTFAQTTICQELEIVVYRLITLVSSQTNLRRCQSHVIIEH